MLILKQHGPALHCTRRARINPHTDKTRALTQSVGCSRPVVKRAGAETACVVTVCVACVPRVDGVVVAIATATVHVYCVSLCNVRISRAAASALGVCSGCDVATTPLSYTVADECLSRTTTRTEVCAAL